MRGAPRRIVVCVTLAAAWLAGSPAAADDQAQQEKFDQLEEQHAGSPERLKFSKAGWLTQRGNTYGRERELDKAIEAFREAVDIKPDYFPAYLSLALAYRGTGQYRRAIEAIESAPATMSLDGDELGGFEYDVYYVKMLVYSVIPDHVKGLEAARQGLEVLKDPDVQRRRQQAEDAGVVAPGSGAQIVEVLEKYVKIREARNPE